MAVNPRLGIASNLPQNATNDLLLVETSLGFPEGQISFVLGDTPRAITGIQKVAQLFIKILLTTRGSDLVQTNLGTNFTAYTLGSNRINIDANIYNAIVSEIQSAEAQTINITSGGANDDASTLRRVNVLGLDYGLDSIAVYLQVVTAAGETASVAIPFPQLDLPLSGQ